MGKRVAANSCKSRLTTSVLSRSPSASSSTPPSPCVGKADETRVEDSGLGAPGVRGRGAGGRCTCPCRGWLV